MNARLTLVMGMGLFLVASTALAEPCESDEDCDGGVCVTGVCTTESATDDSGDEPATTAPQKGPAPRPAAPEPVAPTASTQSYLPLTIAGACTFGAAYIATIALAGAAVSQEDPILGDDGQARDRDVGATVGGAVVPIAGPIILRSEGTAPRDETVNAVLVVLMGVQAMGLLATFLGATVESRVEAPAAAVLPTVTPEGAGVFAVGRF